MKRFVVFCLITVLAAACATSPLALTDAKPVPADRVFAHGQPIVGPSGQLVVVRDQGAFGAACPIAVYVDLIVAAHFRTSETLTLHLAPGPHVIGEHRELAEGESSENVVLEFRPEPEQDMVIACLWNESPDGDGHLLSFAAITDDPAPEVAAAGHDRTIIQIKPEHINAWLTPEGRSLDELQAMLDDRPTAYYEHRLEKAA